MTAHKDLIESMCLPLTEQTALQFWKSEQKKLLRMATIAKHLE